MSKKALVLGATGHTGRSLTRELLRGSLYSQISIVVRKNLSSEQQNELFQAEEESKKLDQIVVPDFSQLQESIAPVISQFNSIFCCLGSSIQQHGVEASRKIDRDTPLLVARLAMNINNSNNTEQSSTTTTTPTKPLLSHFSIITSISSDPNSSNIYLKIKGEVERDLTSLNIPRLTIFRPAGIIGRQEPIHESIAKSIMGGLRWLRLIPGSIANLHAEDIGKALAFVDNKYFMNEKKEDSKPEVVLLKVVDIQSIVDEMNQVQK